MKDLRHYLLWFTRYFDFELRDLLAAISRFSLATIKIRPTAADGDATSHHTCDHLCDRRSDTRHLPHVVLATFPPPATTGITVLLNHLPSNKLSREWPLNILVKSSCRFCHVGTGVSNS